MTSKTRHQGKLSIVKSEVAADEENLNLKLEGQVTPKFIKTEPCIDIKDEKVNDVVKIENPVKDEQRQSEVSTKSEPRIGK